MTATATVVGGSWRELLGPRHLAVATVLAGGVGLYATNEFLTISLLPSAVAEIGGHRLYAWVTTVYLIASVTAATTVSATLARLGARRSYLLGLTAFGLAGALCALAPTMEILLAGRTLQGAAGGLLAGLGYSVINTALPQRLWTKASALVSAMWGVGTVLGPAAGGLFAQYGSWRWAFGALLIATGIIAALVPLALPARPFTLPARPGALPARPGEVRRSRDGIPVRSLLLLAVAASAVSVAAIAGGPSARTALLVLAAGSVGAFLVVDRRAASAVLPPSAFRPGPLRWIYLTLGILMAITMVDMYVPYFGQRLAHLPPVAAGFLGVALAIGWTTSEIVSASVTRRRVIAGAVAAAPLVMAVGLLTAALSQVTDATAGTIALWTTALLLTGVGIGMAWPHLTASAMSSVTDPAEGARAGAAINTVQLVCGAFGAGLAGIVVNATDTGGAAPARWLFAMFAVVAVLGLGASARSVRPVPSS
ncbi:MULTISPECIES: MFS transporter [unclassified Nocardia]|uniref:MFS transporter n=1 Tax=unclassified Nocardia TaxID=2637762 RepID=UPI0033A0F210